MQVSMEQANERQKSRRQKEMQSTLECLLAPDNSQLSAFKNNLMNLQKY